MRNEIDKTVWLNEYAIRHIFKLAFSLLKSRKLVKLIKSFRFSWIMQCSNLWTLQVKAILSLLRYNYATDVWEYAEKRSFIIRNHLCHIENIKVPDLSGTNLYSSNSSIPSVLNCQGTPQENNLHAQSKAGKMMTLMKWLKVAWLSRWKMKLRVHNNSSVWIFVLRSLVQLVTFL